VANSVSQNLRLFLQSDTTIAKKVGLRIHQNHVPMVKINGVPTIDMRGEYLWFGRDSAESERALDDAVGEAPFRYFYDVEVVGRTPTGAESLADAVFARCDSYTGAFGDTTVRAIFVTKQNADYVPRNVGGDTGMHVETMRLEVIP
jgi:hypothetical protein